MQRQLAAEHMSWAFRAIYRENSSPHLTKYPSGGMVLNTRESDPFGNFAIDLNLEEFATVTALFAKGEYPAVVLRPGLRDSALEDVIAPNGFVHAAAIPAMEVDLDSLENPEIPSGFTFERLPSGSDGMAWSNVLTYGYPVAPLAAQSLSPVHAPINDAIDADFQFFAARSGEAMVGISALVLADEAAGIYSVATLPEFRKKGIGKALTAIPLFAAKQLGYKKGVLQASQAGYRVYQSLGFKDAGEVQLYMRMPAGAGESGH
jgi:GNAT superfamily N-acetyltransferase